MVSRISEDQQKDREVREWFMKMVSKNSAEWSVSSDKGFRFKNWLIIPKVEELKRDIIEEAYKSRLTASWGDEDVQRPEEPFGRAQ